MIAAVWPDGHTNQGTTWRELLDGMRREQWHRYTRRGWRKELSRRALAWSGVNVSTEGKDDEFVRRLAAAGLFTLKGE